jgi:hypothetical protein
MNDAMILLAWLRRDETIREAEQRRLATAAARMRPTVTGR